MWYLEIICGGDQDCKAVHQLVQILPILGLQPIGSRGRLENSMHALSILRQKVPRLLCNVIVLDTFDNDDGVDDPK